MKCSILKDKRYLKHNNSFDIIWKSYNNEVATFLVNHNSLRVQGWKDIEVFITLDPKVLLYLFLIRWLNNFGEIY